MKHLLTPEELAKFEEIAWKKPWETNCILRGKFYILNEDMIIRGNRSTSTALLFENAQMLIIQNKIVLKDGDKKYLYIEPYKFTDDLNETPTSKTYKIKIRTYHYEDMLHPDAIENLEQLKELNKGLFVDVSRLPDDISNIKIQVKVWSYISYVGFDCDNNFASWKCSDFSEEIALKLEDTYEVELEKLLGYERRRKCRDLRL